MAKNDVLRRKKSVLDSEDTTVTLSIIWLGAREHAERIHTIRQWREMPYRIYNVTI